MDIISGGKKTGKTSYLVIRSAITKVPILAKDSDQRLNLLWLAREMNVKIPDPILISDMKSVGNSKATRNPRELLIDDVEDILNTILKTKVRAVTHTNKEV